MAIQQHHDLQAERALVGSLVIDPDSILDIAQIKILPEDFFSPTFRIIYEAIIYLIKKGQAIDYIVLVNYLTSVGKIDMLQSGEEVGHQVVLNLMGSIASSANIVSYARIVKEKSTLRKILKAAEQTITSVSESGADALEVLANTERTFSQIAQLDRPQRLKALSDCMLDNLTALEAPGRDPGTIPGLSTGFPGLDNKLLGLQPGQLIILAARPGMGKTSLAVNFVLNAYRKHALPVVIFSLEMMATELSLRIISQTSKIPFAALRKKSFMPEDLKKVGKAIDDLRKFSIYIYDDSKVNIFDIQSECRKVKHELGAVGMVAVDYIQLMKSLVKENREQQIADISRSLKLLAKDLECPVIGLSQLNRAAESRIDKRPGLSDLRESGSLEQDADVVLLIYRDEFYNPDKTLEKNIAEIIIAKNRAGEMGTIKVRFEGEYTSFSPLEFDNLRPVDRYANPYYDLDR